ncbi:unnamed protein product [Cladocopium goreaui]|uniref:Uncharacterized protein n=1 Tax=Cladocopium goreaui TaxID=2562237 RepID=A0A9P1DFN2_9DINO|nr:unnamed protein product [Cladocopium goreaui]
MVARSMTSKAGPAGSKRARTSKEPVQSERRSKRAVAQVAKQAAGKFGDSSISRASAKGALQGLASSSLGIGYAACAAALGAAAAAAAEVNPDCTAEEVAAAAMLAVEEILGLSAGKA